MPGKKRSSNLRQLLHLDASTAASSGVLTPRRASFMSDQGLPALPSAKAML